MSNQSVTNILDLEAEPMPDTQTTEDLLETLGRWITYRLEWITASKFDWVGAANTIIAVHVTELSVRGYFAQKG